ncbi:MULTISPECIES: hypothetical protein [unclassified Clostridium]|uniref:hypothetical protein n=1 Tax=unclassified Clostridium TaxID=2614128 RepID=UPI0002982B1B|nr:MULTISPECIES: hypothetical protein [unclassified Clostridium]EKQ51410.1 MAG: hypothetical protein A370_04850 [Clostridium sp. Maddingley MBC34-26]
MDALDGKILDFIKKSGVRIKFNFLIDKILMGLQASLVLILIILIAALFITIKSSYELSYLIITVFLVISITIGIIKSPKKKEIALIADSKGLNERVITALEFRGDNSEIAVIQKKDTIRNINEYNFKANLPIKIRKKEIYKIIILLSLCAIVAVIPTPAKKEAQNLRDFDAIKNEISKNIDKEEKKIEKENELTKEEKEGLKKILEETKKDLKELTKKEDISKLTDRLDKKFEAIKEKTESQKEKQVTDDLKKNLVDSQKNQETREALKNLNEINNALNKSELGKELLETLKNGDKDALENKLKALNDSLKNLSDKEKSELSNSLKEAAANLSDEELKQLLEQSADGVLDGDIDPSELANALASLKSDSNSGSSGQGSNGKSSENGNGSGSGSGNGSGNGSGSGSGSGGSGNGGGWNTGSKEGKENNSKPSSGEQVFIPGRTIGNDSNLKGSKSNSGTSQEIETQNGLNFNGEKKDYNSVIGDYSKEEIDSMNNSSLPENLQGVVKDYFNNIK